MIAVAGSALILCILVLRRFGRTRLPSGMFRVLWMLAALRLLMPSAIPVKLVLPHVVGERLRTMRTVTLIAGTTAADSAESTAVSPEQICMIVYLLGVLVTAGFFLSAYARLRSIAHRGEKAMVRGVRVRVGEGFASPFTCGILRPCIFLPAQLLTLPGEQLDCILAHERAHIRRLDQPVKWLILAAVCVHWWNPAAWLMLRYANRDIELACDEAVVRQVGDAGFAADYAMCLLAVTEQAAMPTANAFGAPAIRERIECIMKKKHLTICSFICAALILAASTPFFVQIDAVEASEQMTEITIETTASAAAETTAPELPVETLPEASAEMVFPLTAAYRITQGYSDTHPAVDAAAETGSEILAVMDGTVIASGYDYTLGNYVEIAHADGLVSLYAHCEKSAVQVGESVTAGDVIAYVGRTGMATGAHLHFAMSQNGAPMLAQGLFDPADFPKRPI